MYRNRLVIYHKFLLEYIENDYAQNDDEEKYDLLYAAAAKGYKAIVAKLCPKTDPSVIEKIYNVELVGLDIKEILKAY